MRRGLLLVRRWPFLYSTRLIVAATLHTSDYSSNLWQEVYYDSLPYLVLYPGCPCNDEHPRGYVLTSDRLFAGCADLCLVFFEAWLDNPDYDLPGGLTF